MHEKVFEFACEFCPFKTATEQGMIDHVEAVHKTDGKFVAAAEKGEPPKMWWSAHNNSAFVAKNAANEAANAVKYDSNDSNTTPQKRTAERLPPLLPLKRPPPGDSKIDEEETQNHITSAPEEAAESEMYPVPLAFKREYDAEELMEYPGILFNGNEN